MDFVKREDQNVIDEENYKIYLENLQKSHQIETNDYHTQISIEQLHQAMQSSFNTLPNLTLPLSPRHMSTLMFRNNHLSRNDLAHIKDLDLAHSSQHDELTQSLNRNIDLARTDIDFQTSLTQTLLQNITDDMRINENLAHYRNEMPHDLSHEIDLSEINRHQVQEIIDQERRTPMLIQCVPDTHLIDQVSQSRLIPNGRLEPSMRLDQTGMRLEQNGLRLDQNGLRLDQTGLRLDQNGLRLDQNSMRLDQNGLRLDQPGIRLDQSGMRLDQPGIRLEQRLPVVNERLQNDHEVLPMQFPIKSEQEDDYYYDNVNSQGINAAEGLNGQINDSHIQEEPFTIYQPHITDYRPYQYPENPQNLVVQRPFYTEKPEKKENLKPDDNKNLTINIKGEYICYNCNEIFPTKRGLKQHSKNCSDSDQKTGKFSCSQCSYRCQSPAILKIHERTHSGEKPFSCNFCDYKSGQKNNVAKHILVHMKEKPFRCQYCDYRCAQKNNLVVHERTHTGVKPFACNVCDYKTVQKPNLVKHMYLHTNQKPFQCDMCNYKCVQKTNLLKHKQRHVNESKLVVKEVKPYRPRQKSVKCDYCSYKCVQKTSMDKHLRFQHSNVVNLSVKPVDNDGEQS